MTVAPGPNGLAADCGDPIAAASPAEAASRNRVKKAPSAFRTISEVADDLHIPQHVLRFWETKFPQVRPLKRGGGRRYYRPDDITLLRRISDLLYIQGFTIKGVQRLLRDGGGRLSDDIPPPTGDERRGSETPPVESDLPRSGLLLTGQTPRVTRRLLVRGDPSTEPEAELARLRRVLVDALEELEALRGLLT